MLNNLFPMERIRAVSSSAMNEEIDRQMDASVRRYARNAAELDERLHELEAEWDMERILMANAASLALSGVLLSALVDRRWLWLPGVVATFLLQHALQGWCPPVEVFRRLGMRTRREIDVEKYALKAIRGDFESVDEVKTAAARARRAIAAARQNGNLEE